MSALESDQQRENFEVRSRVERSLPVIPDELDNYGLTPAEFRVYGHVSRKVMEDGKCVESLTDMATTCLLSENVILQALNKLTDAHKLLKRIKRVGETDEYTLTPLDEWAPPVPSKDRLLDKMNRKRKKSTKVRNSGLDNSMSKPKGFGS